MQNELIEKVKKLGFSEKEASIYLALLELGKASVSQIAVKAQVNRTTVYDIVVNLESQGMISRSIDPKKKIFAAESPEKIPVILERRAKNLIEQAELAKGMIDELSIVKVKSPKKPKIQIFEGVEGLRTLYDASLTAKSEIRSFLSPATLETFDTDFIKSYFKRRVKKGIHAIGIVNESEVSRLYKKGEKKMLRDVRIVPADKMNIVPEIYIYDDNISIFSHEEKLGVSIESKDIAEAFRQLYDLAAERALEYKIK